MEKGRDLCLYSSTEFSTNSVQNRRTSASLDDNKYDENNYSHIKKKYYTNMYALSKWSKFIRDIFKNDTLDKFYNKMDDGTYILGIPASSSVIESLIMSINTENDEIKNPNLGSVAWVTFWNVMEAMQIANFLQIQFVLDQCVQVSMSTNYPHISDPQKPFLLISGN